VIAKGWESGGRKRIEGPTLLPLLEAVLDAVSLPVIAAGGIATTRGIRAVLAAGADGARVGTRFIASSESEAHPQWIRAVVAARAEDAVVSRAFNRGLREPGPHRVLRCSVEAAEALADDEAGVVRLAGPRFPPPASDPFRRPATPQGRSARCPSTPVSRPGPSARSGPRPRSSPRCARA
jgi:hypothetical protein